MYTLINSFYPLNANWNKETNIVDTNNIVYKFGKDNEKVFQSIYSMLNDFYTYINDYLFLKNKSYLSYYITFYENKYLFKPNANEIHIFQVFDEIEYLSKLMNLDVYVSFSINKNKYFRFIQTHV